MTNPVKRDNFMRLFNKGWVETHDNSVEKFRSQTFIDVLSTSKSKGYFEGIFTSTSDIPAICITMPELEGLMVDPAEKYAINIYLTYVKNCNFPFFFISVFSTQKYPHNIRTAECSDQYDKDLYNWRRWTVSLEFCPNCPNLPSCHGGNVEKLFQTTISLKEIREMSGAGESFIYSILRYNLLFLPAYVGPRAD